MTKQTWGAFTGTDLATHLRGLGVTQVVLAGVATSIGVESTARQAYELGFNVALVVDAMTDMNPDAHTNSVTRIFPTARRDRHDAGDPFDSAQTKRSA